MPLLLCSSFPVGKIPELLLERQKLPGQVPADSLFAGSAPLLQLPADACPYESPAWGFNDDHEFYGKSKEPSTLQPGCLPFSISQSSSGVQLQPGCSWELSARLCSKQGLLPHLCPHSSLSRPCSASAQPFLSSPSLTQDWDSAENYKPLIEVYFPILGKLLGHLCLFNHGFDSTRIPTSEALHCLHAFVQQERSKRRWVGQHLSAPMSARFSYSYAS